MQTHVRSRPEGFSLIETLIAMALMSVALASLAQLFTISMASTMAARFRTAESLLAGQKLEQLRGLAFGLDGAGTPMTDVTTGTSGLFDTSGGIGLSPGGSLDTRIAGYVDFLDAHGRPTDSSDAVYTRRWSIEPLAADSGNTLVVQVLVTRRPGDAPGWSPDDVRMVAVRTRKAR